MADSSCGEQTGHSIRLDSRGLNSYTSSYGAPFHNTQSQQATNDKHRMNKNDNDDDACTVAASVAFRWYTYNTSTLYSPAMQDEHAQGMTTSLRAEATTFVPTALLVEGDRLVVAVVPPTASNQTRRKRQRRPKNSDQHRKHGPSTKDYSKGALETNESDERSENVTNDKIPRNAGDTLLQKPKNRGARKPQKQQQHHHQKQHHKHEQPEQRVERQFSNEKNQHQQKNDRLPQGREHWHEGEKKRGEQQHRRRRRAATEALSNVEHENVTRYHQVQELQHDGTISSSLSTDFLSMSSFPSLQQVSMDKGDTAQECLKHTTSSLSSWTITHGLFGVTASSTPTIDWITQLRRQQEHEKLNMQQQQQQRHHEQELSLTTVKLEPLGGRGAQRTLQRTTQSRDSIPNHHTTLRFDDSVATSTTTTTMTTDTSTFPQPGSTSTTTTTGTSTGTVSADSTDTILTSLLDINIFGTTNNPVHVEIEALAPTVILVAQPNASAAIGRPRRVHNMDRLRNNWWLAWRIRNQRKEVLMELVVRHHSLHPSPPPDPLASDESNENVKRVDSGDDDDDDDIMENQQILSDESASSSTRQAESFDAEKKKGSTAMDKRQTKNQTVETLMGSSEDGSVLWERAQNLLESTSQRALALRTLAAQWIAFASGDAAAPATPWDGSASSTLLQQAVRLSIELDQREVLEKLLRLLSQGKPDYLDVMARGAGGAPLPPLMFAAQLGRDECLSVLLSRPTISSSVSSKKNKKQNTQSFLSDDMGNNVFHMCCHGPLATEFTLQLLLDQLLSSAMAGGKSKKQQHGLFSKVLLGTNHRGQTPLHVACERGRVDFVEKLLEFLGDHDSSLLPKLLVLRDDSHQTPLLAAVAAHATNVVLCLLLWRVNDSSQLEKQQLLHLEQQRQQERQQQQRQELRLNKKINAGSSTSADIPTTRRYPSKGKDDVLNDQSDQQSVAQAHPTLSCPLVWAAKGWNLEMMQLLLEFANDHTTPYQHTQALYACLLATPSTSSSTNTGVNCITGEERTTMLSSQLDCVDLLIQAGANPFQETSDAMTISSFSTCNGLITGHGTTTVSGHLQNDISLTAVSLAAAVVGSGRFSASNTVLLVERVIETGRRQLQERQLSRRRDPMLRQQPETFFSAMEMKENAELQNALSQALVQSLVAATLSTGSTSRTTQLQGLVMDDGETVLTRHTTIMSSSRQQDYLLAAATLYRGGASLRDFDFELLRCKLAMAVEESCGTAYHDSQSAKGGGKESARPSPYSQHQQSSKEIRTSNYKTSLLCRMLWMNDIMNRDLDRGCCCERLTAEWERRHQSNEEVERSDGCNHDTNADLVTLVARDGSRFLVHGTIVSQSSQKLAAAVRFATMATNPVPPSWPTPDEEALRPEIQVDLDPRFCQYLLQHIYHGSIVFERNARTFADSNAEAESETEGIAREVLELLLIAEEFLCPSLAQECEKRLLTTAPKACFCWSCINSCQPQLPHHSSQQASSSAEVSQQQWSRADFLFVRGTSRLLTPSTVLDVLAVIQQLESSSVMKMFESSIPPEHFPRTMSSSEYNTSTMTPAMSTTKAYQGSSETNTITLTDTAATKALAALKDAAICVVLKELRLVVQSEAFQENCSYNELSSPESSPSGTVETSEQALLLLQMCLEEFGASPFTAMHRKKKHLFFKAKENATTSL
jgi:ankyrin repeat protein